MTHIEDVLLWALAQNGKPYIFGYEIPPGVTNPKAADCSELVEFACRMAGVTPTVPDGAYYQWKHCNDHGLAIPLQEARETPGALMFVGDGIGVGREAITHVAFSLGKDDPNVGAFKTIEARGSAWGIGVFSSLGRFNFGALIPGVDYSTPHPPLPPEAPLPNSFVLEDEAVVDSGVGRVDKFRNNAGKLEQNFAVDGSSWSGWFQPPGTESGTLTSPPYAASDGQGNFSVYGTGTDGNFYVTRWTGGPEWSPWAVLAPV